MTNAEKVTNLTQSLNKMLADKANLDESITALKNMINGVNLGAELQKDIHAEELEAAKNETPPEE